MDCSVILPTWREIGYYGCETILVVLAVALVVTTTIGGKEVNNQHPWWRLSIKIFISTHEHHFTHQFPRLYTAGSESSTVHRFSWYCNKCTIVSTGMGI
jgi:hypothetical protein